MPKEQCLKILRCTTEVLFWLRLLIKVLNAPDNQVRT